MTWWLYCGANVKWRGQSDLGIIVPYYNISRDYRTWISKKVDIVKEYSVKEREKHKERVKRWRKDGKNWYKGRTYSGGVMIPTLLV